MRVDRPEDVIALSEHFPNLAFPLFLVQEDVIGEAYRSLGIGRPSKGGEDGLLTLKGLRHEADYSEAKIGGTQADSNEVIDSVKGRL